MPESTGNGTLALIAAMDRNRVIGRGNALPWRLPADLRHFKQITLGKTIVMGRKTYESIGRPLPGRTNLVVTRQAGYDAPGCVVVSSLDQAIAHAGAAPEVVVIGGATLYREAMPRARCMYLTLIDADYEGDAVFPQYDAGDWIEAERIERAPDADNPHRLWFVVLERKP